MSKRIKIIDEVEPIEKVEYCKECGSVLINGEQNRMCSDCYKDLFEEFSGEEY